MASKRPIEIASADQGATSLADAFVGRQSELRRLEGALADAREGAGRAVLVTGDPGIGKTRLADELSARARKGDACVLWGRCWEGGGAPAYWPWVQVIRSYVRARSPAEAQALMATGAADIAQVVPEVRAMLPDLPTPPSMETDQGRFRLFDSVGTFLRRAAEATPLVVVLDDLHSADSPSLLLLQFVAREMRGPKLLILATFREVEARLRPDVARLLAEVARESEHLPLRGLLEEDVAEFVGAVSADLPAGPETEALAAAVYRVTEGNPFFVKEILRLLVAERGAGCAERLDVPKIPDQVRGLIHQRLETLTEPTKLTLRLASAIGREFEAALLDEASEPPAASLQGCLAEAVSHGLIVTPRGQAGRYAFAHNLFRETLYDDIEPLERARLHDRIVRALETLHGRGREAHLAELAHHSFHSLPEGSADRAIEYAERAGDHATDRLAYEDAVAHFERGLAALDARRPSDRVRRCELLISLGEARVRAANTAGAREAFEAAARLSEEVGLAEALARAALGCAGTGLGLPQYGGDTLPRKLLEQAVGALGDEDSPLRMRVQARLAMELHNDPEQEKRRSALSDQALEMARRFDDNDASIYVLHCRHFALWSAHNAADRLEMTAEMIRRADAAGADELTFYGRMWRVLDLWELGAAAALDREIELCAALADELRQPRYVWITKCFRAGRARARGRFDEAERLIGEVMEIGERSRDPEATTQAMTFLLPLRNDQGRLQELEAVIDADLGDYAAFPGIQAPLTRMRYELGRHEEARVAFERIAANDFTDLPESFNWLSAMAHLAALSSYFGDVRRAELLYALLLPHAGHNVLTGHPCTYYQGPVSLYLGQLAATMSRWDAAVAHFEDAVDLATAMDTRPFRALTRFEYTRMLLARSAPGDRERSTALLGQARDEASAIGMKGLAGQIRALEARPGPGGQRLGRSAPTGVRERTTTFKREGDYWTIGEAPALLRLKDGKGLRYLRHLLAHPSQEFHAVYLASLIDGSEHESPARATVVDGEAAADPKALAAYRGRLDELRGDLAEATRFNDVGRVERTQAEMDAITRHLASALGLGGRARKTGSIGERARISVTRRIKAAEKRVGDGNAALARYLANTIKTGTFCVYEPDPNTPIRWLL